MADVDLSVAVVSSGVPKAIEDLTKLIASGRSSSKEISALAAASTLADRNVSALAKSASAAGAYIAKTGKTFTDTGKDTISLTEQLRQLEDEYKRLNLVETEGATASSRLARGGGSGVAERIAEIRAALSADAVADNATVGRERAAASAAAAAAAEREALAQRQLAEAMQGRVSAQQQLSRAREDYAAEIGGATSLERAQTSLTRAMEDQERARTNLARATGGLNGNKTNVSAQLAYNDALIGQARATDAVTSATARLAREQELANKPAAQTTETNGFQSSFAYFIIAGAAQKVAGAIGDIGTQSITASASLERSFADVDRTFEGTHDQLIALENTIVSLSQVDPISTTQIAQIATLGNQLGISAENIRSFTQTIAEYSAVSGETAEASATAFGKIGALTGISAAQYSNLGSAIEYVARTSVSTESGIQNTAQEITAIASGAGFSADAIVGLSGALASLSIPPERARGALSLYFGALNSAVAEGGPKLSAFATLTGLTTEKISELVNANKGQEVFTSFISGLSNLNNVAKTTALDELGLSTIRVDQTMRALSQNVPLVTSSLAGSAKAFKENTELGVQYGKIQKTLTAQWIEFQSAVQNAMAGVGDLFNNDGIKGFLAFLSQSIAGFREFSHTIPGQAVIGFISAIAILTFVAATLVGGLALLAASMKLVPWALSGLEASTASKGITQFLSGLLGYSLAAPAAGAGGEVVATSFRQIKTEAAQAAAALKAFQIAQAGLPASEAAAAEGALLEAAAMETQAVATRAAAAGARTLRIALISTGIGAVLVLIGSIIAAFTEFGDSVETAADKTADFFKGQDTSGLEKALAADQATFERTGQSIDQIGVKVKVSKTTTDDWVSTLNKAGSAQAVLGANTQTTTKKVEDQTVAFGAASKKLLGEYAVNNKAIQSLFKDNAGNNALANTGFDSSKFVEALVGSPEGGKAYIDNYTQQLAAQLGTSQKNVQDTLAEIGQNGFDATRYSFASVGDQANVKIVDSLKPLAGQYNIAAGAVDAFGSKIKQSATDEALHAAVTKGLTGNTEDLGNSFVGAADGLGALQDGLSAGLGKFGDFAKQIKALEDANKAANPKNPKAVTGKDFAASLQGTNESMIEFYKGIKKLATDGNASFATQLAAVGPDASGILADTLKMSPAARRKIEENSRLAAFLVSKEFTSALQASAENDNKAYAQILTGGGSLKDVKNYIHAQVKGVGDQFEQEWDALHPDFPLGVHLQNLTQADLDVFKQINDGKITVKAKTIQDALPTGGTQKVKVKVYTDTVTGKQITLPANLDGKALSRSLAAWQGNEGAKPSTIAAKLNTKGFSNDIANWASNHGPVTVYANLVPTASSVAKIKAQLSTPGNFTGGLLDAYGKGQMGAMPSFATGSYGKFRGGGSGTSDSLLARVSSGEYIHTADATNFWGASFMDSLSRKMLPPSFANMLGAAAASGSRGPTHVAYVNSSLVNPVTRDPLAQLREESERLASGIWGS